MLTREVKGPALMTVVMRGRSRSHPWDVKGFSCPICGRPFTDAKTRTRHMMETTRHEDAAVIIRRLTFELAEMEDNLKFWRDSKRSLASPGRGDQSSNHWSLLEPV